MGLVCMYSLHFPEGFAVGRFVETTVDEIVEYYIKEGTGEQVNNLCLNLFVRNFTQPHIKTQEFT